MGPVVNTIAAELAAARRLLRREGCTSPELDARLLLMAVLEIDHAGLILAQDDPLPITAGERFHDLLARRRSGEPVSRILAQREFYGRLFTISPAVLDPRPDTETLIEVAFELFAGDNPGPQSILDLGCGSGAIIITLLAQWDAATGTACDIDPAALQITQANAKAHGVASRLKTVNSDWTRNISAKFDLIVSNPPYIPCSDIADLPVDVRNFDPLLALNGGEDGLSAYHQIIAAGPELLHPGGYVLVEIGADQAAAVSGIFHRHGFSCETHRDLAGRDRVIAASFNGPA